MKKSRNLLLKLTYLQSASILMEDDGVKVLSDPWLIDGAYFGSWAIYPPFNFKPEDFYDVDYIYLSHIHPDHFHGPTLEGMNKDIPILILNYLEKSLKNNIEQIGFKVTELEHNKRIHLKNNLHINILAADNCNPELCGKFLGCGLMEKKFGATWIDSMCVIDNNENVFVNTNDCPFELAKHPLQTVKNIYKNIDMLCVGYGGAGPYPQCFDLSDNEKKIEADKKLKQFLAMGESYVSLIEPKYFMPFAGRYTLTGRNHKLNQYTGVPELEEAFDYFNSSQNINHAKSKCLLLNPLSSFDIKTGKSSDEYKRIDFNVKKEYVQNVLSKVKYDYEKDPEPTFEELSNLISESFKRFELNRKQINYNSDTNLFLKLTDNRYVAISLNGNGFKFISKNDLKNYEKYVRLEVDKRLLRRLLQGPRYAVWNTAEIGSHIRYFRKPNIFERALYYCMNYFFV